MNNKKKVRGAGMGVGYVSVMIVFASICLTIFAVLSLRAAGSNDAFNERSGEFLRQYYAADSKAKLILSQLDECAKTAVASDFFEESFELAAGEIDGVTTSMTRGGCKAVYSVEINDRQKLSVEVTFKNNGKYEITRWQSKSISSNDDDSHINVWDGTF